MSMKIMFSLISIFQISNLVVVRLNLHSPQSTLLGCYPCLSSSINGILALLKFSIIFEFMRNKVLTWPVYKFLMPWPANWGENA